MHIGYHATEIYLAHGIDTALRGGTQNEIMHAWPPITLMFINRERL